MAQILEKDKLNILRRKNLIKDSEIAYLQGDIYIAEDILNGTKRMINVSSFLNERKVLND